MSPVATESESGGSTRNPAPVVLAVVIVLIVIGLLAIFIFIARRRARSRQNDGIRTRRIGRPQPLANNGGKDRSVDDDAKEKISPLKTRGGTSVEVASIASVPYSYGADTFYPAPPPRAVVSAHKKKRILSNLSPFRAETRARAINSPTSQNRVQQLQDSVMSNMAGPDETWSQIDLQTPGGHSTHASTTMSTIPAEVRALRYAGSTEILAAPPTYSRVKLTSDENNGQPPPLITLSPATPVTQFTYI